MSLHCCSAVSRWDARSQWVPWRCTPSLAQAMPDVPYHIVKQMEQTYLGIQQELASRYTMLGSHNSKKTLWLMWIWKCQKGLFQVWGVEPQNFKEVFADSTWCCMMHEPQLFGAISSYHVVIQPQAMLEIPASRSFSRWFGHVWPLRMGISSWDCWIASSCWYPMFAKISYDVPLMIDPFPYVL